MENNSGIAIHRFFHVSLVQIAYNLIIKLFKVVVSPSQNCYYKLDFMLIVVVGEEAGGLELLMKDNWNI